MSETVTINTGVCELEVTGCHTPYKMGEIDEDGRPMPDQKEEFEIEKIECNGLDITELISDLDALELIEEKALKTFE